MTPQKLNELRSLGEKYGQPVLSLTDQAANYITLLEKRVAELSIKNAKLYQQAHKTK